MMHQRKQRQTTATMPSETSQSSSEARSPLSPGSGSRKYLLREYSKLCTERVPPVSAQLHLLLGGSLPFFSSLQSIECSFSDRVLEASTRWSPFWPLGFWRIGLLPQKTGGLHQGGHKKGIQCYLFGALDTEIFLVNGVYAVGQAVSVAPRVQRETDMVPDPKTIPIQGWEASHSSVWLTLWQSHLWSDMKAHSDGATAAELGMFKVRREERRAGAEDLFGRNNWLSKEAACPPPTENIHFSINVHLFFLERFVICKESHSYERFSLSLSLSLSLSHTHTHTHTHTLFRKTGWKNNL